MRQRRTERAVQQDGREPPLHRIREDSEERLRELNVTVLQSSPSANARRAISKSHR